MEIDWNSLTAFHFRVESVLGISMEALIGRELYDPIHELGLTTVAEVFSTNRKGNKQEEASSSSGHVKNEGQESPANIEDLKSEGMQAFDVKDEKDEEVRGVNVEQDLNENLKNLEINPNEEDEQKTVGTIEEQVSTENVEIQDITILARDWSPEKLKSAISLLKQFGEVLFDVGSEVEESTVLENVARYRSVYTYRLEKLKMEDEASGSSSHGENEEQESNEKAKNDEEQRTTEDVKTLEENFEKMKEKQREEAGASVIIEESGTENAASSSNHGRNQEQESSENVENRAGNPDEEQELNANAHNHEEQRMPENVQQNPVNVNARAWENQIPFTIDNALKKGKKIKTPYKRRR
ncbi:unnamed protein product [Lactuca saligna]|uniref:Uncharacterized protein n=1 Tax=Lactuca saligna TaxID=75948 RepID=A0AA36EKS6_LACSI|nr:unnamed protein product [Lactuca saligna]